MGDLKKTRATVPRRAEIEDFRVHDREHAFASRLVMKGIQVLDGGKLLGHKSIKMTRRYARLAPTAP